MTTTTARFPPPGSTTKWDGRAVANARAWYAAQHTWPTPCARCGRMCGECKEGSE